MSTSTRAERRKRLTSPPAEMRLSQRPLFVEEDSLDARFATYHAQHPDVYEAFKAYSVRLLEAGVQHYGAKTVMEIVRYHRVVDSTDGEAFKINNNYTSRYARLLADEDPRFNDFFSFRVLKSA